MICLNVKLNSYFLGFGLMLLQRCRQDQELEYKRSIVSCVGVEWTLSCGPALSELSRHAGNVWQCCIVSTRNVTTRHLEACPQYIFQQKPVLGIFANQTAVSESFTDKQFVHHCQTSSNIACMSGAQPRNWEINASSRVLILSGAIWLKWICNKRDLKQWAAALFRLRSLAATRGVEAGRERNTQMVSWPR